MILFCSLLRKILLFDARKKKKNNPESTNSIERQTQFDFIFHMIAMENPSLMCSKLLDQKERHQKRICIRLTEKMKTVTTEQGAHVKAFYTHTTNFGAFSELTSYGDSVAGSPNIVPLVQCLSLDYNDYITY